MARRQPSTPGVWRIPKSTRIHAEVERTLRQIAAHEDKSFSRVLAEIVYAFFELEVSDTAGTVKVKLRNTRPHLKIVKFERKKQAG